MADKFKYEEMYPDEFLEAVERLPVFFVPTGLLEWHDNHLPLGLDALKAHGLCLRTAEKLGGGIVLPPNYYGRPGYSRYIGTLTFSEACVDLLLTELFGQLRKVGAKVIVLLTGHYGPLQVDFIKRIAKYYQTEFPDVRIIAGPEYEDVLVEGEEPADHAGKWETAIFRHFYPDLTRLDRFKPETDRKLVYENPPHDYYKEEEEWVWEENLAETATPERGALAVDIITDRLARLVREAL